MRIAHCQFEPKGGDFDANLAKVVEGLKSAELDRAEIVSFPECFLTGYQDDGERARKHAFSASSPQMMQLLDATSKFDPTVIVGFNETRGDDLYNTAAVAYKGHLLGTYSKCAAYMPFHKQGREFPVFERETRADGKVKLASSSARTAGTSNRRESWPPRGPGLSSPRTTTTSMPPD